MLLPPCRRVEGERGAHAVDGVRADPLSRRESLSATPTTITNIDPFLDIYIYHLLGGKQRLFRVANSANICARLTPQGRRFGRKTHTPNDG